MNLFLPDEAATTRVGRALGRAVRESMLARPDISLVICLHGELGAGKTALARAVLQACGVDGPVRSPTYTLIEPYRVDGLALLHLDLYRLADSEELEFIGIRDLMASPALWLVEWPSRGQDMLPPTDLDLHLAHHGRGRTLHGRAATAPGEALLQALVDYQ